MKKQRITETVIILMLSLSGGLPAQAKQICKVTDPTGTPLNVRSSPNGKIINTLRNNRDVEILEIAYDNQNRPWAKVGGYCKEEYRIWGWVIREFISCYEVK